MLGADSTLIVEDDRERFADFSWVALANFLPPEALNFRLTAGWPFSSLSSPALVRSSPDRIGRRWTAIVRGGVLAGSLGSLANGNIWLPAGACPAARHGSSRVREVFPKLGPASPDCRDDKRRHGRYRRRLSENRSVAASKSSFELFASDPTEPKSLIGNTAPVFTSTVAITPGEIMVRATQYDGRGRCMYTRQRGEFHGIVVSDSVGISNRPRRHVPFGQTSRSECLMT